MEIYSKPGCITVSYDEVDHVVIFDWTKFVVALDEIKELHQKALKIAQERDCYDYIAETSKVKSALPQPVIEWWGQEWVPELVKAGLRSITTVVPSSAIAKLSTRSWQTEVVDGITMKNVQTLQEAKAFVNELRKQ
jgi:hypothetical protein